MIPVSKKLLSGELEPSEYFENPVLTKSGEEKLIAWHNTILINNKGEVIGHLSSGEDITKRKKAELALKESEKKFQYLYDYAPNMLVSVDAKTAKIVDCNLTLANELGKTKEEIIGQPVFNLYAADSAQYARENVFPKFIKTGFIEGEELQIQRKDGSLIDVILNVKPVNDSNGNLARSHSSYIDITERKKVEEELKESELRYRKLFEDSPVSLWEEDFSEVEKCFKKLKKQGIKDFRKYYEEKPGEVKKCINKIKIVDINKSTINLHQAESKNHLLSSIDKIFIGKSFDVFREELITLAQGAETFEHELTFTTLADEIRHVFLKLFVGKTKDNKRNFSKVLVAISDITESKRAEEERLYLEKQILHTQKLESLGVLAGGIAHDFNNLLAAILGNADLALRKLSESSPSYKNVKEVINASHRAADLTNQMLAYSGKGKFVIELVNLSEIVNEMSNILEVSISKKAKLKYNFAEEIPFIEADLTQIRQIVMNLITNASEAIGDNIGAILIETGYVYCNNEYLEKCIAYENSPENYYSFVEVTDTGCGMDDETISKLFDPFFTSKFTGRGLGMATVLGIVRSHKGVINVKSELGKGTAIKVFFPVVKDFSEKIEETEKADSIEIDSTLNFDGTVLVADDEEGVRTICTEMLETFGLSVITAEDGEDALNVINENKEKISCIILDYLMPKLDGEQIVKKLKESKINIPIIISSGYTEQEISGKFDGKGIVGFIQKPFLINDLALHLKKVLD